MDITLNESGGDIAVTIQDDEPISVTIIEQESEDTVVVIVDETSASSGGGSWGSITGTLSDQIDLNAALAAKQNSLGYTPENVANKATDFSTVNDTLYPSVEAVQEFVFENMYVSAT